MSKSFLKYIFWVLNLVIFKVFDFDLCSADIFVPHFSLSLFNAFFASSLLTSLYLLLVFPLLISLSFSFFSFFLSGLQSQDKSKDLYWF